MLFFFIYDKIIMVMYMITYRKFTYDDIDIVTELRIKQLIDEGSKETIDIRDNIKDYYKRHLADNSFISYLAIDDDKIVATSGIAYVEKPPYFTCPSGKIGLVTNMYTLPEYRRQGIAKKLLSMVIDEAKVYGCDCIQITASKMGVYLYTSFGFEKRDNFMQYIIKK